VDYETSAQLELLKVELASIQGGIRGLDTILFQIKGWCVTICVAVAGVALATKSPELLLVAAGAIIGFWLVDAHYKAVQRVFIERDTHIEVCLKGRKPIEVLRSGDLTVPGLASGFQFSGGFTLRSSLVPHFTRLWREAKVPMGFSFYAVLTVLLSALGVILLAGD
jgi:hypothetical protein